jgi:hypothetical protein
VILTAHQPVYLPWLGLFHKIALCDTYVFLDSVKYLKQDWNNRNKIKGAAGPMWLTVPVATGGTDNILLPDVRISNEHNWRVKHWRSIRSCYGRAPYFDQYAPFLEDVYRRKWEFLNELNLHMLRWFLDELGVKVRFLRASELDLEGTKSDLVLDMCRKLGAKTYIFGALGRDYAQVADFERAGVDVIFQDYRHPQYPQLHGGFISHLSIIDLIFNCGPKSLEVLMKNQEAISR